MIKESAVATALTALLGSGGAFVSYKQFVEPLQISVKVAENKADSTNLVAQKLVEDRIKELEAQKKRAAREDRDAIQRKIDAYVKKKELLEQQILK
jgi:hypothetical protein